SRFRVRVGQILCFVLRRLTGVSIGFSWRRAAASAKTRALDGAVRIGKTPASKQEPKARHIMPAERPDSAAEAAPRTTIAQAASLLAGRDPNIPADFLSALYQRAGAEDLLRYAADDLDAIAGDSFRCLTQRTAL